MFFGTSSKYRRFHQVGHYVAGFSTPRELKKDGAWFRLWAYLAVSKGCSGYGSCEAYVCKACTGWCRQGDFAVIAFCVESGGLDLSVLDYMGVRFRCSGLRSWVITLSFSESETWALQVGS